MTIDPRARTARNPCSTCSTVDSPLVQRELGVAATNANTAIEHLEEKGILTKVSGNYCNRKRPPPMYSMRSTSSPSGPGAGHAPRRVRAPTGFECCLTR
jgi:hypothetical protein